MKKLIFFILLFWSFAAGAQVFQRQNIYGVQYKRLKIDSTLHIPTVCGTPSLKSVVGNQAAIAFDSCNNKLYVYDPKDSTWNIVSGGEAIDSIFLSADTLKYSKNGVDYTVGVIYTQSQIDSIAELKLNISDTANMLLPYPLRSELQDTAAAIRAESTSGSSGQTKIYIEQKGTIGDSLVWVKNDTTLSSVRVRDSSGIITGYAPDGGYYFMADTSYLKSILGGGTGTPAGSNGYIQFNNSGSFGASSNFFWDNTNGRLGIGTSSPAYALQVSKNSNTAERIDLVNSGSDTSTQAIIEARNGVGYFQMGITGNGYNSAISGVVANSVYIQSNLADKFYIRTTGSLFAPIIFATGDNPTEKMRLFANGTLAINQNTDSTSGKLVVNGGISTDKLQATKAAINMATPLHALDIYGNSAITTVGVGDVTTTESGAKPLIYLQADATNSVTSFNSRWNYPFTILVHNIERLRVATNGNTGFGVTSPTATIHLKAGTATASTSPLKFTSGVNLTTPEAGAMEYNGTNLFFTPSTVRNNILMTASVNTVSPTSPNRTLTVVIDGTTYYIAAKTTND